MTGMEAEDSREKYKQQAADRAVTLVESGMVVGLGTGSTAVWAMRGIAQMIREEKLWDITAFATSTPILREAVELGIPMIAEDMPRAIDITIDGADEVDPRMNLIKGGGGALLREKVTAQASRREVIVVDDSKISPFLGLRFPLPVEVLSYGWRSQFRFLESLGAKASVRYKADKSEFRTD